MGLVAKRIVRGSFWLSIGRILSTLIAFAGSIIIARLLSPDEYGLIGVALIFPNIFPGLLDFGLSTALIRFTSLDKERGYVSTALVFKISTAFLAATIMYIFSDQMAAVLARPYIAPMMRVLSIYIFGFIIVEAVKQVLIGIGEYHKVALLDILRNILRVTASVILIIIGLGVYGAIWGFSIASIGVLIISMYIILRNFRIFDFKKDVFRELMAYSLPLYIPIILGLPLNQAVNILLARYTTNFELGNYSVACNLVIPLNIVGGALSTSLFSSLPLLLDRKGKLCESVVKAVIYTSVIILPISLALITFSEPIVYMIYGESYSLAPLYLLLLASLGLLAPLGRYVIVPYLNSIGETKKTMKINMVYFTIYIPLAITLIMIYGIVGIILSNIVASLISALYGGHILHKEFNLMIFTKRILKLLVPLSVPAITSVLSMHLCSTSIMIKTIVGAIAYLLTLAIMLPVAIKREEIIELKNITEEIKILGSITAKIFQLLLIISVIQGTIKAKIVGKTR